MQRSVVTGLGCVVTVVLAIGAPAMSAAQDDGSSTGQENAGVSNPRFTTTVTIKAPVSSTFTYQGVLEENGAPVSGDRDMTFQLYSDDSCTTAVGAPTSSTVPVEEGLFTVELTADQQDLNGQALWLGSEVNAVTVGCQAIQAAPYALSLRPGATVLGSLSDGAALTAGNSAIDGTGVIGLSGSGSTDDLHPSGSFYSAGGEFAGPNGVIGAASADNDDGYGIIGLAAGTSGRGVLGRASSATGYTSGVYGDSGSSSGYGLFGVASSSTGSTYGVYGRSDSNGGYGVSGIASSFSGTTYGVHGTSSSPDGYGGYFANTGDRDGIDLVVGGGLSDDGIIASEPGLSGSDLFFHSNDEVWVRLDRNGDDEGHFEIQNGDDETVLRVDEDGNTEQPRAANGLVKAAASVYCSSGTTYVIRQFNNVNGSTITVSSGTGAGECTIDFGFQVNDRFWSATAVYGGQRIVTCVDASANDQLDCYRYRPDGTGYSGQVMVLIY
jgi:hypothetical protein